MPVARPVKVVLAAKFDGGLTADTTAFLGFIEVTTWGKLNFTHRAAHKTQSQEVWIGHEHSKCLLDKVNASFPAVFMEPTYFMWENHAPLSTPLIDPAV